MEGRRSRSSSWRGPGNSAGAQPSRSLTSRCPAMTSSRTPTSPQPALYLSALRPTRCGRGSPSWVRDEPGSAATTSSRNLSAATSTVRTGSCPSGRRSRSATRSGSLQKSGSRWPKWTGGDHSFFAAGFRWEGLRPLRLHVDLRPPRCAARDHTAARARTICVHSALGPLPCRTRRGGQLRDDPAEATSDLPAKPPIGRTLRGDGRSGSCSDQGGVTTL